jgi:hypothetical protein
MRDACSFNIYEVVFCVTKTMIPLESGCRTDLLAIVYLWAWLDSNIRYSRYRLVNSNTDYGNHYTDN